MSVTRYITISVALWLFSCQLTTTAFGQKGVSLNIKKPKEFENRVLRSEKSDQKKFSGTTRFIQNTVTRYNFYFNANNKLIEVMDRAKAAFSDDYSELLPFYNYSLDVTAADSVELDSISYKSQSAIVLHDLRSDWADNMYLLWGTTYFLRQQFDSAHLMFQFINYAFAQKEKDGYYLVIGSARDGNNPMKVSSPDKNRLFGEPPSRNDAFIWQIRTFLEQDRYSHAASLIQTLRNDPTFPPRLQDDLAEMQAYFFYRQEQWDSAAAYLEKALSNAPTKQEKARWEYLLGQLYEISSSFENAENWYSKSIGLTTDPILDIYARLATIRVNKDGGEKAVEKNIEELLRMARRDKYVDYRDVIYYMAAQMELERNNPDGAIALLQKSIRYQSSDPAQRNKTFLQLAGLSFDKGLYRQAYGYYDSLQMSDPLLSGRTDIPERKSILARLADNQDIIHRQDSLQALVALPEDERKDVVRKLAKRLRKQQGLKEEAASSTGAVAMVTQPGPTTLFAEPDKKGEWYFYNSSARQKGFNDFRSKWGNRPNSDNWRRSAAARAINTGPSLVGTQPGLQQLLPGKDVLENEVREITFTSLYDGLPLTPEKMQQSNDSIQNSLFAMGYIYVQELEDCALGTKTFEELRTRFPNHPKMDEALFNLYLCYSQHEEPGKAAAIKKEMQERFPGSNNTTIVATGKNPQGSIQQEATRTYEAIYDRFIEGDFATAIAQKKDADQKYGANYWTPQLLYIEAVYYIKQREDSTAKTVLVNLINQFGSSPVAAKATTLLDVLSRRAQIEEELRNLVINMPAEDTARYRPAPVAAPVRVDTIVRAPQRDTTVVRPGALPQVVMAPPKPRIDSTVATQAPPPLPLVYNFEPDIPHYVVIILNKVDPVFVNEARNAFARYNRDTYYNKQMQAELVDIDADNRLLLISPFRNASEAVTYVEQTKPKTSSEIVPWLKGGKFSYSIITAQNLELLKSTKDINKYTEFLEKNIPGKF